MTDDLGPEQLPDEDLAAVLAPSIAAAAGVAAARDDDEVVAALRDPSRLRLAFADVPVTEVGGRVLAALDVELLGDGDGAGAGREGLRGRLAEVLDEALRDEGYTVHEVREARR